MSQLHLQLESLELVRSGSLDLFAHSLIGPLLHAVESLADVHLGGIVLVCLLERRKVDVQCREVVCFQVVKQVKGSAGNEGKYWQEGHCRTDLIM